MPESWIDEMVGDEAVPRHGFEDDLAKQLKKEWRRGGSPAWRPLIWAAAAVAVVVGASLVVANRDNDRVAPADSAPTTPVTQTTVVPSTSVVPDTTPDTTPTSSSTTTTVPTPPLVRPTDEAEAIVYDYFLALSNGQWDDAGQLLNEGGLELEARADLRPLFRGDFGLVPYNVEQGNVADALRRWCEQAICDMPTTLTTDGNRQVLTWQVAPGLFRSATFAGYTFEGYPGVQGLPLQTSGGNVGEVDCPTIDVISQSYADLNGDGWFELLVVQPYTTGAGTNRLLTVCGTDLVVTPTELEPAEGIADYAVNPTASGDFLFVSAGYDVRGRILQLEGSNLVQPMSSDGPATFLFTVQPESGVGEAAGCGTVVPGAAPTVIGDSYEYIGGTELSNSTGLRYIRRNIVGRTLTEQTFTLNLPAQTEEAFQVIAGFCNGLPVITG
ncbi:MAG TPA: hypothetical protein VL916_15585 [Ilumatobacteraceae bacterium]|nr:hypothetical protein [Ilumatobacteraceae bacterium]